MNKSQRASETQSKITTKTIVNRQKTLKRVLYTNFVPFRNGGLLEMKERITGLKAYLSDPTKRPSPRVMKFVQSAIEQYETAVKASIGMPTYSDSVTLQYEAPKDIPTVPLDGFQLVSRTCYVPKLATLGTTAGGFYANLISSDMSDFTGPATYYRIKKVTSWTVPRADGNVNQSCFAGVSVPASSGAEGTEVLPIWSENWTPVGVGFAGVVTQYPLGDFPQLSTTTAPPVTILSHFTSLGGTGGVASVPVVFHVDIECLV